MLSKDGYPLDVEVWGSVPHTGEAVVPLVVLPASWAASASSFAWLLARLADSGYLAVAYTPRGFHSSGGRVEGASHADVQDFSTVVDWVAEHYPGADTQRVAAVGLSYGAGISLLAAAFDPRVATVAAIDGWADLGAALMGGDTPRLSTVLLIAGALRGRLSTDVAAKSLLLYSGLRRGEVRAWADRRSAGRHIERFDRPGLSVLLAAGWNDTVLRPEQVVAFREELPCRSLLLLHPDDHPVLPWAQLTSVSGREIWHRVSSWLDSEMLGLPDDFPREGVEVLGGPVWQRPPPNRPAGRHAAPAHHQVYELGPPRRLGPGRMGAKGSAWRARLRGLVPSGAVDRVPVLSRLAERVTGHTPSIFFPLIPGTAAASWTTTVFDRPRELRGSPVLRGAVSCSARKVTLTAHLYTVEPSGIGRLCSQGAVTLTTGGEGPVPFSLTLRTAVCDVPAGHRLGLVVGTWDATCRGSTRPLSKVVLHSSEELPASLTVPLH
ncbi:CocE/NonD family hydrolase [Streptomyces sp. NPDC091272]|uniref:CocE/NonD family hydrolase n=1 Tax=Streptomyces sp. NPDC091272 TaxID=3365981 RepID=UPI00382D3753